MIPGKFLYMMIVCVINIQSQAFWGKSYKILTSYTLWICRIVDSVTKQGKRKELFSKVHSLKPRNLVERKHEDVIARRNKGTTIMIRMKSGITK